VMIVSAYQIIVLVLVGAARLEKNGMVVSAPQEALRFVLMLLNQTSGAMSEVVLGLIAVVLVVLLIARSAVMIMTALLVSTVIKALAHGFVSHQRVLVAHGVIGSAG